MQMTFLTATNYFLASAADWGGFDTVLERIRQFCKRSAARLLLCSPFWHMGIKIEEEKADGINSKIISRKESVVYAFRYEGSLS